MDSTPRPDAKFAEPLLAAIYDTEDHDRSDLAPYEAIVHELDARTVIDVGCGTGSLAVRLAVAGCTVTGVDPAAASLDVARAKAEAVAVPPERAIRWIEGDATHLPTLGADLAVMTGNVSQVFTTDESWQVTLQAIRGALRTGGHLVFESRRPAARGWEAWEDPEGTEHVMAVPGIGEVRVRQTRLDVDLPLVTFSHEYTFPDGTVRSSTSTLRFREESELRLAALLAGFEVVEVREAPDRPGLEHVVIARAV